MLEMKRLIFIFSKNINCNNKFHLYNDIFDRKSKKNLILVVMTLVEIDTRFVMIIEIQSLNIRQLFIFFELSKGQLVRQQSDTRTHVYLDYYRCFHSTWLLGGCAR